MGYEPTIGVIIYWNKDQPFVIHIYHNVWFDKYNHFLPIEDTQTTLSLLLQKYTESNVHN